MGGIRSRLGQTAAAEQADRQALEILNGLASEHPAELAYRESFGPGDRHEPAAPFSAPKNAGASPSGRPRRRWRQLGCPGAVSTPRSPVIGRSWAMSARQPGGDVTIVNCANEEAEAEFRQAVDAAEGPAREKPEVMDYQESLARILHDYALLQLDRADFLGSERSLERSVAIVETLARTRPDVTRYQFSLGRNLATLGQVLADASNAGISRRKRRRFSQAEHAWSDSITILEKLAADHPRNTKIAAAVANSYWQMHVGLLLRGSYQSAIDWSDRADSPVPVTGPATIPATFP